MNDFEELRKGTFVEREAYRQDKWTVLKVVRMRPFINFFIRLMKISCTYLNLQHIVTSVRIFFWKEVSKNG